MQGSAQQKKEKKCFNPKNAQDLENVIAEDFRDR